ncbi:MAG TPA: hypothetical protein VKW08_08280 [Xanthobacteraceae bacterium]|jgi:hypothetical protein|nr:hypothetical protein [Xanthobacteraceae bacterium]
MRMGIAISLIVHALILLWVLLGPGARALNSASAEPVIVDLVSPQEAGLKDEPDEDKSKQSALDQSKAEQSKGEPEKAEQSKLEQPKTELPKPDASKLKPSALKDTPKPLTPRPDASKPNDSRTAEEKEAEERAATAARLAWMLDIPVGPGLSLSGASNGLKANLTSEQVASFKAQIAKCWAVPKGTPRTPNVHVVIRIALTPDGRLGDLPLLVDITDGAYDASVALAQRAGQALQECQPYAALPADKYDDWKVLDMSFTSAGPSGIGSTAGTLH